MAILAKPITNALMITAFVGMMMIGVEYVSVLSRGAFQRSLAGSRWLRYVGAALLGAIPGCLGAFTVVALYAHRVLPLGAVVAAMIATSGDEAFVMFALFPTTALWIILGLAVLGVAVGPIVDRLARGRSAEEACPELIVHEPETCLCFPGKEIIGQWRKLSLVRGILTLAAVLYVITLAAGVLGPGEWNWLRITLLLVGLMGGFVVATVPDHFLLDHIWRHVALKHIPRIFAWTFGVLIGVSILGHFIDVELFVQQNRAVVLIVAVLIGVIPESGPHLIFVTLFSTGALPISALIASSIVQDGHGMLPLLAESRSDFIRVKTINVLVGLVVGAVLLSLGL
jgi:hypothetical protein